MNTSKKLGIAIFLLFIGSLEARHRLTNDEDKPQKLTVRKAPAPPPLTSKKHHKKTKKSYKAPNPPHRKPTVASKKRAKKREKDHKKEVQRKKDRAEAKRNKVSFGDGRLKTYQQELNYGFMVYHKESSTDLLDAVQALATPSGLLSNATQKDVIEITKSKPAPQVSYVLSAVYENLPALFRPGKTTEAAIGIQASFAKKNDAYQGTHKDAEVEGNIRTRQSIKKWAVLVFGQYELFRYNGFRYNFKLGAGLSVGALRELRVYEKDGNLFHNTGQFLIPKKSRPTVEFGLNVAKEAGPLDIIFAYDVGYVKQTYHGGLELTEPDARASQAHHDNHTNLRENTARHLVVVIPPVFKLWSFNFKLGAGFNF